MHTIFALATAQGRAGVAIVRISGEKADVAACRLMRDVPAVRGVRSVFDSDGVLLDEGLILQFPEKHSFTGEKVVELHLHGSPAIVAAVLRVLGDDPDLRQAEPGEFTRRALENGRLDLAQVEGLADLIDAETEMQRRQALRVFSGELGEMAAIWRAKLVRAAALLEATIDFVDEDVPVDVLPDVRMFIGDVRDQMRLQSEGVKVAERLREGFEVAIIGKPNVGKSTLLNRLAGRDAAITSELAGTTRDVIEVRLDLCGIPVTLLDTAGLRETDDRLEGLGIARAEERAKHADLRIYMRDDDDIAPPYMDDDDIVVQGKADLGAKDDFAVSGKTGEGVDALVDRVGSILAQRLSSVGIAMRERHRVAMMRAIGYIDDVESKLGDDQGMVDLIAEDLRSAIRAVDSIIGRVDVEQVLDEIFSSFCIGK